MRDTEVFEGATLTATILRYKEECGIGFFHGETADLVAFNLELHAADAHGATTHATHFINDEGVDQTFTRGHEDLVARLRQGNLHDGIAFFNVDGDNAATIDVAIIREGGTLNGTIGQDEGDVAIFIKTVNRQDFNDAFFLLQAFQDVDNRRAERGARAFLNRVGFLLVHATGVGEEEEVIVGIRHVDAFDKVFVLNLHAREARATTSLSAVVRKLGALHITTMRERDHRRHIRRDRAHINVTRHRNDGGQTVAFLGVLRLDLFQVFLDEGEDLGGLFENSHQFRDASLQLSLFVQELVAFQTRQLTQTHFQDGLHLSVRETETFAQTRTRFFIRLRIADDVDDFIEVILSDEQAIHDVHAFLSLAQIKAGATRMHVKTVIHVALEEVAQGHTLGTTVIQGNHIRAEGRLQIGVLVQLIQDHFTRIGILLQFNDDAYAFFEVGLIADICNPLDDAILHEFGHLGNHRRLVHHVRDRGDQDAFALTNLSHFGFTTHRDGTATQLVHLFNTLGAAHQCARGEVRTRHKGHQFVNGGIGMIHKVNQPIAEFTQVVRRDVRGHTHGNTLRTVQQQVRQLRGQHTRFAFVAIVVRHEVNRFLVDIGQHFVGDLGHTAFGVTRGCGAVTIQRTEVTVTIDQRYTQAEPLGHTHQRVVNRTIAVRVILTHHFTDHTRRLHVLGVVEVLHRIHGIEHTAVNRLKSISSIGEGTRHNHTHRIINVGVLHFLFYIDGGQTCIFHRSHLNIIVHSSKSFQYGIVYQKQSAYTHARVRISP